MSAFDLNSDYSVLLFNKPEQQLSASILSDALLSAGFKSSASSTYLSESKKQFQSNQAWVIYSSQSQEKLSDVKIILDATKVNMRYIFEKNPSYLRQGDIQILLF
jgi:hypothetical protein